MIQNERTSRHERSMTVAGAMITAARTAPKARGNDLLECAVIDGDDITRLSEAMKQMHAETGRPVYERDSANILQAAQAPCAMNITDVGIAIGSACATAADHRVDTRVLFSAGMAAMRLDILPGCRQVFAIPVSISSKSPFFDR